MKHTLMCITKLSAPMSKSTNQDQNPFKKQIEIKKHNQYTSDSNIFSTIHMQS